MFIKNVAMLGGALFISYFGAGPLSLDAFMVLTHTHQGTFGDPYYGGNANLVGWDLIQYPGIRTMVSPSDQKQLETNQLKPNHKSAYDYESFAKASPKED